MNKAVAEHSGEVPGAGVSGSADAGGPRTLDLRRLAIVGVIVAAVGGAFLYAGGWLSPHKLTPDRFIDTFEQINGVHPGFRRNHAKGVGVSGYFESNGRASRLSMAVVFRADRVPVLGRFALAGGTPDAADAVETTRSMALQFLLPDGEEWRTRVRLELLTESVIGT